MPQVRGGKLKGLGVTSAQRSKAAPDIPAISETLPGYVVSGEVDPVVGPGQAFARALIDSYRAAGLKRIDHRVYPGGRHEMFNETCRGQVEAELVAWLDRAVG